MAELTQGQRRAMALANARLRESQFFVQLPDGRVDRVNAPANASPQEVLTQAESMFGRGVTLMPNAGPETFKESMAKASEDMGFGQSVIAGLGTKIMDADARIRQLLGYQLDPKEQQAVTAGRDAPGAVQAGRLAGDIAIGAPALPQTILGNALAGAGQRFLTDPVLSGESGTQNALEGAIGGAAGSALLKAGSRVIRPITPSPDVRTLLNEGIVPTIGEAARSGGSKTGQVAGAIEDAATSYFGIGQAIGSARQRAGVQELGRAVLARATPQGMDVTSQLGREGLAETAEKISQRYTDALNNIKLVRGDAAFVRDMRVAVRDATRGLTGDDARQVQEIIQSIISDRQGQVIGAYTPDVAKRVDADLGQRARDFFNKDGSNNRLIGEAIRASQKVWRDLIRRNAPDQATRDMLDDANRAFANYIRAERATNKSGAIHGEFNATNLAQAVRETSGGGSRKTLHGRGEALMQDLSDPAKAVLSTRLGESGTTPRALLGYLAGAGLGAAAYGNEQVGGPTPLTFLLGAAAASPLLYSRAASRYALGDLLPGQNIGATFLENASPLGGLIGRSVYEPQ